MSCTDQALPSGQDTAEGKGLACFTRHMPRIGLGLAALGRPGYINLGRVRDLGEADSGLRSEAAMRERAEQVLDAAWVAGVRWFDAARSYGLSEDFLGTWLRKRGIEPEEVCVTSKWGYEYTAGWLVDTEGAPHEVKDHSLVQFEKQLPESVAACGEFIRLYQVHSATFDSGILDNTAVHMALAKLRRDRGWRLGLSVSSPKQGDILDAAVSLNDPIAGSESQVDETRESTTDASQNAKRARLHNDSVKHKRRLFDCVQVTYNVLEQSAHDALVKAHSAGVQVIVKEAVANGRALMHPAVLAAAAEENVEVDELALACVLAQPFEPFVLSGAATSPQIQSNLRSEALAKRLKGDPDKLAKLMASFRQDAITYWKERAALPWN